MKTLTLQVTDELYEAFQQIAAKSGRTTEEVALEWLAKQAASKRRLKLSPSEAAAARLRFERHFGEWDSGDPNSADNERIDADLTREYGSAHEEEV